ncbi:MAG TPA: hypothetical protein VGL26_08285, partial [Jatrophihabitans sp.]
AYLNNVDKHRYPMPAFAAYMGYYDRVVLGKVVRSDALIWVDDSRYAAALKAERGGASIGLGHFHFNVDATPGNHAPEGFGLHPPNDRAEVLRCSMIPVGPNPTVEMKHRPTIDVLLSDSQRPMTVVEIRRIAVEVTKIIDRFAPIIGE